MWFANAFFTMERLGWKKFGKDWEQNRYPGYHNLAEAVNFSGFLWEGA